ncbi:MAG TPA: hypothetical protein VFB72_17400 [Verrucomicrobiae bacterium]|nr:hypothetical protein [Verrucomicrobiae bacterium]
MAEKPKRSSVEPNKSAENELDALNMELRTKRDAPKSHRRQIEASIEAKAKKRRRNEAPVSSSFKPHG